LFKNCYPLTKKAKKIGVVLRDSIENGGTKVLILTNEHRALCDAMHLSKQGRIVTTDGGKMEDGTQEKKFTKVSLQL